MSINTELTEKTTGLDAYYQEGDYVVPSFSPLGTKIRPGKVFGDRSTISAKSRAIAENALRRGAELLPIPEKNLKPIVKPTNKSKNQKLSTPSMKVDGFFTEKIEAVDPDTFHNIAQPEEYTQSLEVVFKNQFGKIKVSVIAATVDERSVCLIFKDEKELRFEPEIGDKFDIIVEGSTYNVFYPGFLFTWIDKKKKIMVLGRILKDNDEA